jgi:hypothetical protein
MSQHTATTSHSGFPLHVPNRSDALPTLIELDSHPLVPNASGRILYFEVEPGIGPAAATFRNGVKYSAPSGGPASIGKSFSLSSLSASHTYYRVLGIETWGLSVCSI